MASRLNDATLDKVARNAASTWAQSGHLVGRTFKRRRLVLPTPAAMAFALWLAQAAGFRGEQLLASPWVAVLDCSPSNARSEALEAKRLGLMDLRAAGDVLEFGFDRLDPALARGLTMGRIEQLADRYGQHIATPWQRTVSGAQRVIMVVYDPELERTLRAR